jgi:rubredoxin
VPQAPPKTSFKTRYPSEMIREVNCKTPVCGVLKNRF